MGSSPGGSKSLGPNLLWVSDYRGEINKISKKSAAPEEQQTALQEAYKKNNRIALEALEAIVEKIFLEMPRESFYYDKDKFLGYCMTSLTLDLEDASNIGYNRIPLSYFVIRLVNKLRLESVGAVINGFVLNDKTFRFWQERNHLKKGGNLYFVGFAADRVDMYDSLLELRYPMIIKPRDWLLSSEGKAILGGYLETKEFGNSALVQLGYFNNSEIVFGQDWLDLLAKEHDPYTKHYFTFRDRILSIILKLVLFIRIWQ